MRARSSRLVGGLLSIGTAVALVGVGSVGTGSVGAGTAVAAPSSSSAAPNLRSAAAELRRVASLHWHACAAAPGFQCATMRAPLDYDAPNETQIGIAMIRHPATDSARRAGTVFWNPGGPGAAATVNLPAIYPLFAATLRARFDIVGIDPRGIGGSAQLRCFPTPEQEDDLLAKLPAGGFPVGAAQRRQRIAVYAAFDRACATHGGPIQYHMSTANDARDLDRARQASGEKKLNYYGISYGTYLGVTYANLFPSHLGRIVLDGNVSPVEWSRPSSTRQLSTFLRLGSPQGSEAALHMMLRACGKVSVARCAFSTGKPATMQAKYRTLLRRVRTSPVTVAGQPYTYALTVATTASLLAEQNNNGLAPGWKALAALLQQLWTASSKSASKLQPRTNAPQPTGTHAPTAASTPAGASKFPSQLPEGLNGVVCGESPNPSSPRTYARQAHLRNVASRDGFSAVWSWLAEPCAQWTARDADRYTGPWNRFRKPYLLVGTLGDPETAYTSTLRLAREVPNARVLTETGGGHTSLFNKSDCVDDYLGRYFLTGSLPAAGTVCQQNRLPF